MLRTTGAALASAALCFLMTGCAGTESFGGSRERVEAWAAPRGFRPEAIDADGFALFALIRRRGEAATLTVYIEGDGAPWPSLYQPPRDPTPFRPLALVLAERDPAPLVSYLGRPCQYLDGKRLKGCNMAYWSGRRFAPEAVAAMDEAVNRLKSRAGARHVRLIGYSGGGVVAALLAMRRDDVVEWVTIAAPLALSDWTAAQGLSPLTGSLDPLTQPASVITRSAVHFAGAKDAIVLPAIVARFVGMHGGRLETLADFDHDCCWVRDWVQLLQRVPVRETLP